MKPFFIMIAVIVGVGIGFGVYRQMNLSKHVVVVYTPTYDNFIADINRLFEELHPDYKVQTVHASTSQLEALISSEKDKPLGDVMFAGDLATYLQLKKNGLIQPVEISHSDKLPMGMKDPDKTWYAVYEFPIVIFYNDSLVDAAHAPKDWGDLVNPEWKDAVLIRNPTESGVARAFYLSLIQAWGEERAFDFFHRLNAQMGGNYATTNDKLLAAIIRGEAKVSVMNEADIWIARNEKRYPLSVAYPKSGSFVTPEPVAMIAGAPHPEAAREYMEFLLGFPALELASNRYYKRPARTDYPKKMLPPEIQESVKTLSVDWLAIGDQGTVWLQKWSDEVLRKKMP